MFEDLRGYLSHLEEKGQLLRVKDEVDVKYEIAAGMRKTSDIEGPALLFENVKGFPGWRVLGGLFATRKLVALGLGVPQEKLLERYLTLEDQRIAPEKLIKCDTIAVEAPPFSETVIEGVTVPGERVADGPYGEYPGCYSEAKQAPVLKVTAITMRKNPIYQTALTGMPVTENHTLIEYGNAAVVYREVKKIVPEVKAVHMTPGGK